MDQSWADIESQERLYEELRRFTNQSGIRVDVLPAPEAGMEQLAILRRPPERGASVPDVYAVDVIWPGTLADELLDLRTYMPAQEIAAHFPELIAANTVNGRLVALPFTTNAGLLFYRVDLLREYGYRAPPKTWEELEAMATRIQNRERARGHADFWGYVWQGAPSESLTCNALEWQASEGAGTVIEDGTVTIDNPYTVRAWKRAARWVGTISPPGVVAYREGEAFNMWQAGQTAFMRNWSSTYAAARLPDSPTKDTFEIAPLPGGRKGTAATLGGNAYGVSLHSRHAREAAMLVRFLCGRDEQRRRCLRYAGLPTIPDLYIDREVVTANPYLSSALQIFQKCLTLRPTAGAGKRYSEVSRAWYEAVHSVLTRKAAAPEAAAALKRNLVKITGLTAPAPAAGARQPGSHGKRYD